MEKTSVYTNDLRDIIAFLIAQNGIEGSLILRMDVAFWNPDTDILWPPIDTAAIGYSNGKFQIRINNNFWDSLTVKQKLAVLRHELAHFINKHHARFGDRSRELFNIAADMAINQFIPDLPAGVIDVAKFPTYPKRESAEVYYELLKKDPKVKKCYRQFDYIIPGGSDLENAVSTSQADQILKDAIREKLNQGTDPGTLRGLYGGALDKFVTDLTAASMINWKTALTRFVCNFTRIDPIKTLKRPDKRQLSPWGSRKERLPKLIVAIDTSGSVSEELLHDFFGQVRILGMKLSEVRLITCDAELGIDEIYRPGMEYKIKCSKIGRGGTSYQPVIALVNKKYRNYDGIVYLSDGECPLPSIKSRIRLLWVITSNKKFPGHPVIFTDDKYNKK